VEGVAKTILAFNETLKTISGLNNTFMLWILIISLTITITFCAYTIYINKRLKKSEESHETCLREKKKQDIKIQDQDSRVVQLEQTSKHLQQDLLWARGKIDEFFVSVMDKK